MPDLRGKSLTDALFASDCIDLHSQAPDGHDPLVTRGETTVNGPSPNRREASGPPIIKNGRVDVKVEGGNRRITCADVGGVFEVHSTDGGRDCVSADAREKCHIKPADQPSGYLAELTMTPPVPDGSIDYPFFIDSASNKDCWREP